jgi:DNA-binding transcriptional LysR family regulator
VLLRQLQYLAALAREKHFARAATVCEVTQPTLSAGIKQLEETFGVLIVERGQRFRGLTPEGERVLEWAMRVLSDYNSLEQELSGMKKGGGLTGRLRIGAIPTALPVTALLTSPFVKLHPGVTITILSRTSIEIQRGIEDFELDIGLTYLDNEPLSRVRTIPLYQEHYLLFTPRDSEFGGRSEITWREAAALPLCLLTPDMQNRRILDGHFRDAGVHPDAIIETNSTIALYSHLRSGEWSTILPQTIFHLIGEIAEVRAIPLIEPVARHTIGIIAPERDPLPPVVRELLALVESHALASLMELATSHGASVRGS